ncbi:hypothetical protein AB0E03_03725 [Streptomyces fumanus]
MRRIKVRLARHTCGTLLAFLKVPPKVAQAILRHSQISMTMDVYTHVVGDSERAGSGRHARRASGRSTRRLIPAMDVKDPQPIPTGGLLAGGANRI